MTTPNNLKKLMTKHTHMKLQVILDKYIMDVALKNRLYEEIINLMREMDYI